jgi:hypothetical protein
MSSSSNTSIAKKARTKAEADFATWLVPSKPGRWRAGNLLPLWRLGHVLYRGLQQ